MLEQETESNPSSGIVVSTYIVKDGNGTCTYQKKVDLSKPKIYVEGFEYKFNSNIELISKTI